MGDGGFQEGSIEAFEMIFSPSFLFSTVGCVDKDKCEGTQGANLESPTALFSMHSLKPEVEWVDTCRQWLLHSALGAEYLL